MVIHLNTVLLVSVLCGYVYATYQPLPSTSSTQPSTQRRVPKQIHTKAAVVDDEDDHSAAETHFGGAGDGGSTGGHGKYFMDTIMIQTGPKKVEFGHVCEDPDDWEQRYERQDHDNKRYQGKARWGDKHGGYGEHYWDYNHGGHHGDDGGSSDDEGGDASAPVPEYDTPVVQDERVKREHEDSRAAASSDLGISLAYDTESGTVVDEATGQRYLLTAIN